jgi:hypothetical protein
MGSRYVESGSFRCSRSPPFCSLRLVEIVSGEDLSRSSCLASVTGERFGQRLPSTLQPP